MRAMPGRSSFRAVAVLVAVLGATVLVEGTALAQTPSATPRPGADVRRAEDQVVLSGTVTVPRGRSVGQVVVFHGRAVVAGVVVGDVVVLDGPVEISGQVSGTVVAMNGPIRLGATASIGGDVLGAQGVRLDPGALVAGDVREDVAFTPRGTLGALGALLGTVAIAFSTLLVLLLLALLAPRGLDRVAVAGRTAPFASIGWGLAIAIALPLLALATAASILGLPLGLSLLLGFGLLALVGYAFAAFTVGRSIVQEPRGRVGALFAGWGLAAAIGLVPFLNVAVFALGSAFGLGAGLVAIWRVRSGTPSRGRHRPGFALPRAPSPAADREAATVGASSASETEAAESTGSSGSRASTSND
jgi:hypothetical protein